jgi:hypothetical protein
MAMEQAGAMSWTTHPFRRQRGRGVAALAVVLATLVLVHAWARSPLLTALGALLLLVSVWPFYVPVRYRLDDAGVEADYGPWRRRWAWDRFRAFVPQADGAVLTPFVRPHPLERWRAVLLPCPDAAALQAELARRLARREVGGRRP